MPRLPEEITAVAEKDRHDYDAHVAALYARRDTLRARRDFDIPKRIIEIRNALRDLKENWRTAQRAANMPLAVRLNKEMDKYKSERSDLNNELGIIADELRTLGDRIRVARGREKVY